MPKMTMHPAPHYTVVQGSDLSEVVNTVNQYCEHGYVPAGGISAVWDDHARRVQYTQAVFHPYS
jgi:hypothetical protein